MDRGSSLCFVVAAAAVTLTALLSGCATSGIERRADVVSRMEDTRNYVARSRTQLAATLAALNGLPGKSGDALTTQYRLFGQEFERFQSLANDVGRHAASVRERGDKQLNAWQDEAATVQDPELRRRAEARRAEQGARYDAFAREIAETQRTLYAFLTDLRDIRRYLDADLTPEGVANVRDKIAAANRNETPVMQSLARLDEGLTALAAAVAPGGTPAAATAPAAGAGRPADAATISEAQRQLKAAGFDPGSTTGTLDEPTRDALRRYQRDKGFPVTGQLDEQTRAALLGGRAATPAGARPRDTPRAPRR
ncbi:MAG: peptidoglycan-binding domain-containing protein [Candidatus Methylomirabilales bacterium]